MRNLVSSISRIIVGGNKTSAKEEKFRAEAELAFDCLDSQRAVIREDEYFIESADGAINGYAFGFLDACLQAKRLDIRDPEGESTLLDLLGRLFPAEAARVETFLTHLRKMSRDAETMDGVMLGGKQAVRFLRTGEQPERWALCFLPVGTRLAAAQDKLH
jgi:hypothetical protein